MVKAASKFSARWGVCVQLAYYPPYHSKYNPIERVFGVLENMKYFSKPSRASQKPVYYIPGMGWFMMSLMR
ncbi:MAG: ISAzo13 family transposase, partial [Planctomycetota bacterium]|jgi:transposase|nr:ISAzo13 family transposase [Planctomycetota bacterium]